MKAGAVKGLKRASDLPEIELQVFVSCPTWVLGIELRSRVRAVSDLKS